MVPAVAISFPNRNENIFIFLVSQEMGDHYRDFKGGHVENNSIARINAYARQYVPYTFICLEIKTNTETVALGMFEKVQRTLGAQVRFFLFLSWKESLRAPPARFFLTYSSSLSVLL